MVSEKMVMVNGSRVPLSVLNKDQPKSEESKIDLPADPAPVEKPLETIKARLDALKESGETDKLATELEGFEASLRKVKRKADLIEIAAALDVEADDTMKMVQILDLILLPYKVEEPEL